MAPARIIIVRHAERLDHIDASWADTALRPQDSPLSAHGKEQARLLGVWLKSQGVVADRFFVSPFIRTCQTAEIASQQMDLADGCKLCIEDGLVEGTCHMAMNEKCVEPW